MPSSAMRRQPDLLLLRSGADGDRIAAEESGQHRGRDAQVDARHLLADAVDVEGAAAHAAELFGNEQELDAQLVRDCTCARTISSGHSSRSSSSIKLLVGQALLGEILAATSS